MQHQIKNLWQYDTNSTDHFPTFSLRLDEESSIISNQIENHYTFNLESYEEKQINISKYFTFREIQEPKLPQEQEFFIAQLKKNDSTFQQLQPEISDEKINDKDKIQSSETKNIPKNFGKQIIKFVNKNEKIVESILQSINSQVKYSQLNTELQKKKSAMNKISDLKNLWLPNNTFNKEMRIISSFFFRKFGVSWIFNSRVTDYKSHLKYRNILATMIGMPDKFLNLKVRF